MKDAFQNCYEAAARLVCTKNKKAFLVHGWIHSTKLHRAIQHAWVESDGKVYDFANYNRAILPIETYYREGHAQPIVRYTRDEAIKMMAGTRKFQWWTLEQRKKILGDEE